METLVVPASQESSINLACTIIASGQLVAFPTDTVYGLGADLHNPTSIRLLYEVKGRDIEKAIAVLIGNIGELNGVAAEVSPVVKSLTAAFWPGALTLVLPRCPDLPANLSPLATIGVRMPNHPEALHLLHRTGPLAVTSANLSGFPNAATAQDVLKQLSGKIPLILDGGRTPDALPSTVVDCTGEAPLILRPGPISLEMIRSVLS